MNLNRLKQAEAAFLQRYPGGFDNPEIMSIRRKKHNVDRMILFAQERFSKANFKHREQIAEDMTTMVSRASILSVFEKVRFREFAGSLFPGEKHLLSSGLEELLHGSERLGFDAILNLLRSRKLAKWSLMTISQTYFHPQRDVLVKPMTVKGIIQYFELTDLQYRPAPSWDFYDAYRSTIHGMKSKVDGLLSPTNAAFSWFLLLSLRGNVF